MENPVNLHLKAACVTLVQISFQIVFEENKGNVILSPFSVKLLMSLLFEASAAGTLTQHQLRLATPTISTHYQSREFYKNIFNGLKVNKQYLHSFVLQKKN